MRALPHRAAAGPEGPAAGEAPMGAQARRFFGRVLIPAAIMATLPALGILLWIVVGHFAGSVRTFAAEASVGTVIRLWPRPSLTAAWILAAWVALQALLLVALPGRRLRLPTPAGDHASYRLNGVAAFLTTVVGLWLASCQLRWFPAGIL